MDREVTVCHHSPGAVDARPTDSVTARRRERSISIQKLHPRRRGGPGPPARHAYDQRQLPTLQPQLKTFAGSHRAEALLRTGVTDTPEVVLADAGYSHTEQMQRMAARGIPVLIPPDAHKRDGVRPGWTGGMYEFMRDVLNSEHGKDLYRRRQGLIEPAGELIGAPRPPTRERLPDGHRLKQPLPSGGCFPWTPAPTPPTPRPTVSTTTLAPMWVVG